MIAHLQGKIIKKAIESIIVDVGGVGYEVFVPLSTYYNLPDIHQTVSLNIHTYLRDDAITLYGFSTSIEKGVFNLLISVSGVGPKLAKNILSGISAEELADALSSDDTVRLRGIPGIGGKTAERLVVELRDKVKTLSGVEQQNKKDGRAGIFNDLLSALVNLGYKQQQADRVIQTLKKDADNEANFELLFKKALKMLSK